MILGVSQNPFDRQVTERKRIHMTDIFIQVKAKSYRQFCEEFEIPENEIYVEYPEYGLKITVEEQNFIRSADFGSIILLICSVIDTASNLAPGAKLLFEKLKKSQVASEVEIIKRENAQLTEALIAKTLKEARESNQVQAISAPTPAPPTIPEQIQQLAVLHATGALTDEEFTAKKAELLARI